MQDSSSLEPSFLFSSQDLLPVKISKRSLCLEFLDETFLAENELSKKFKPRRGTLNTIGTNASYTTVYDSPAKVIIVGDSFVGKTCLIQRFTQNKYDMATSATLGVTSYSKKVILKNSPMLVDCSLEQSACFNSLNLQIWDTAGSERFRSLTHHFFKGSKGIVLVIDLTKRSSFTNLNYWMDQIRNNVDDNVVKCLFCNKCDESNREVSNQEIMYFCEKWNTNFFEGSAKNGTNVDNMFHYLSEEIHENITNSLNRIVSLNNLEDELDINNNKYKKYNAVNALSKEVMLIKLDSKDEKAYKSKNNDNTCC